MSAITCRSALKNCKNPHESMGEICVLCNKCGRFNKEDNKEKKIEELTNELIRTNSYGTLNAVAEHLYNAGYRKQIEGEWLTDRFGMDRSVCSVCGAVFEGDGGNYCRKCGAKMKGGVK